MLTKEEKAQFAIRKALRKNAILCLNEKKIKFSPTNRHVRIVYITKES